MRLPMIAASRAPTYSCSILSRLTFGSANAPIESPSTTENRYQTGNRRNDFCASQPVVRNKINASRVIRTPRTWTLRKMNGQ